MTSCTCFLQEGQISDQAVEQLEEGIRHIVVANNVADEVQIFWIVVPKGHGWTAGEPSTSSVVSLATRQIEQQQRVKLMQSVCELWMTHTSCHINEILVSVIPTAEE